MEKEYLEMYFKPPLKGAYGGHAQSSEEANISKLLPIHSIKHQQVPQYWSWSPDIFGLWSSLRRRFTSITNHDSCLTLHMPYQIFGNLASLHHISMSLMHSNMIPWKVSHPNTLPQICSLFFRECWHTVARTG